MSPRPAEDRRSFEAFNYNLRPAKHIERRLMMELFQRLGVFHPLSKYRYVGMGSIYFVDFVLIHRLLGITNLVSIEHEHDPEKQRRFSFNAPFRSVRMMFEESSSALEKLDWKMPSIAWLDYDGKIEPHVFTDVATVTADAETGTLLIVTLNASREEPTKKEIEKSITEVDKLRKRLPAGKLPVDVAVKDLQGWGVANVIRRMLRNQVIDTLAARNGILAPGNKLTFRQVFNFQYRDAARMVTAGFLFYRESEAHKLAASGITDLEGYSDDENAVVIEVPHLTHRELRYLEKQLPLEPGRHLRLAGITEEEFEAYRKFYRHYPTFAEAWM